MSVSVLFPGATVVQDDALRSEGGDVPRRRATEKAGVLAAELRRTEIADLARRAPGVQHARQHQVSCLLQAEHLLVLQRRHVGDRLEVLVERRHAHVGQIGQVIERDGLREVLAHPRHGRGHATDARLLLADLRDTRAGRTEQQPDEDLVDDQRREELRLPGWAIESTRRAAASTMAVLVGATITPRLSFEPGTPCGNTFKVSSAILYGSSLSTRRKWLAPAGLGDPAGEREMDGVRDEARGVVGMDLSPEHDALGALRDDAQRGEDRRPPITRVGLDRLTT